MSLLPGTSSDMATQSFTHVVLCAAWILHFLSTVNGQFPTTFTPYQPLPTAPCCGDGTGSFLFPQAAAGQVFVAGTVMNIQWTSTFDNTNLYVLPNFDAGLSQQLITNTLDKTFQWTVTCNFPGYSNCSTPWLIRAVNALGSEQEQELDGFTTSEFWIRGVSSTTLSSTTSSASSSLMDLSTPSSSPASSPTTSTVQSSDVAATPSSSSDNGRGSSNSVAIGAGVGIGVGVVLITLGLGAFFLRRHQQQKKSMNSPSNEHFRVANNHSAPPTNLYSPGTTRAKSEIQAEVVTARHEAPTYPELQELPAGQTQVG